MDKSLKKLKMIVIINNNFIYFTRMQIVFQKYTKNNR